ncbi:hypothetical protein OG871_26375 [Kitasatospora sp. NBC_00374]|uniref:hypothetical protein n=1 Tax=Kitasatospora sp. NBC_00374 TaxID=2975964 RepID=UPI0030DFEF36
MLRHVTAPSRDFTQIANDQVWDDSLSDAAFRLLVRSLALPPARVRSTTVTHLAAGLSGGRITVDRARRQLSRAGLLHSVRWRNATGQVRTESLVSNVRLSEAEAERLFTEHLGSGTGRPGAGERDCGEAAARRSGTAHPRGETPGEEETSPLPVPAPTAPPPPESTPHATPHTTPHAAAAERVLLSLRRTDPRLLLGAAEVRRLVPMAAEWLARGVDAEGLRHALTAGLPQSVKSPAGLLRTRLRDKLPPVPASVPELAPCTDCDRAFRSVSGEARCGDCRRERPAAPARPDEGGVRIPGVRIGWRERVALVVTASG